MRRAHRWAAGRPSACAVAASLLLLCVVAAVLPVLSHAHSSERTHAWALLALTATFFAAQSFSVDVEFRRQSRSVSLSEIPFVLSLVFLAPGAFLVVRTLGGALSQVLVRRQHRQPVKLAFNSSLMAAEAAVGCAVFVVLDSGGPSTDPRGWGAAVLGALAANAVGALAVDALLSLIDTPRAWRDLTLGVLGSVPQAAAVSSLAVVIGMSLHVTAWAALPVAGVAAVLVLGYSAYAELRARHLGLERLYTFSQQVTPQPDTGLVIPAVLRQLQELLRADCAFVTLFDESTEWSVAGADEAVAHAPRYVDEGFARGTALDQESAEPVLLTRGSANPLHAAWRRQVGRAEAAIVPLRADGRIIGALGVADRVGDARTFSTLDVQLLQTVAAQVVTALQNTHLLDQLRHDALHDPLTHLPNRKLMEQQLAAILQAEPCAVALVELGALKTLNHNLGHQVGDEVVRTVAGRLRSAVRQADLVARLSADQFVVLLTGTTRADEALASAERLLSALITPIDVQDFSIDLGVVIGFLLAPEQGTSIPQILRHADQAIAAANRAGLEILQFRPEHDQGLTHRLDLVSALRAALADNRLELYGQPKIDVASGRLVGVEALSRWTDPVHGPVPPDVFIGLAERSGMMRTLTTQVLEKSLRACAAWQPQMPGVGIAVNLSTRSLLDRDLLPLLDRLLTESGLEAELLTLEITESSVMSDGEAAIAALEQCRARGVRLSVDDFGTGYSSLSYLRRLPVQEVKIDKSFVLDVDQEHEDRTIVQSIVELGHALGLSVVAEGVERPRALDILRELRCDIAQGYLIARPLPIAGLAAWSKQHTMAAVAPTLPLQPLR